MTPWPKTGVSTWEDIWISRELKEEPKEEREDHTKIITTKEEREDHTKITTNKETTTEDNKENSERTDHNKIDPNKAKSHKKRPKPFSSETWVSRPPKKWSKMVPSLPYTPLVTLFY